MLAPREGSASRRSDFAAGGRTCRRCPRSPCSRIGRPAIACAPTESAADAAARSMRSSSADPTRRAFSGKPARCPTRRRDALRPCPVRRRHLGRRNATRVRPSAKGSKSATRNVGCRLASRRLGRAWLAKEFISRFCGDVNRISPAPPRPAGARRAQSDQGRMTSLPMARRCSRSSIAFGVSDSG